MTVTVGPHAKLAAHIAFDAAFSREHEAWLETWPTFADLAAGIPLLWPERTHGVYCVDCGGRSECDCDCAHDESRFAALPSPITGLWTSASIHPHTAPGVSGDEPVSGLLPAQQAKFARDLLAAQRVLAPDQNWESRDVLDKWTWAWCSVNTRCFYYLPEEVERPQDADEAMVLGPGMDLFNHAAGEGENEVRLRYGPEGFEGLAQRDLEPGEEVWFSYGSHGNDSLMADYGFVLGSGGNKWDGVGIDGLIIPGLSSEQREVLEGIGYSGDYNLNREGLCWRSEVVARLLAAEDWRKWEEGVRTGEWGHDLEEDRKVRALTRGWVECVRSEAEKSLRGLRELGEMERNGLFVDGWEHVDDGSDKRRELGRLADARYDMCMRRWQQILDMATAAAECV